jgi:hypothetical protein
MMHNKANKEYHCAEPTTERDVKSEKINRVYLNLVENIPLCSKYNDNTKLYMYSV